MQAPIAVLERYKPGALFPVRADVFFKLSELPPQVSHDDHIEIVREVPCVLLDSPAELVAYAVTRD